MNSTATGVLSEGQQYFCRSLSHNPFVNSGMSNMPSSPSEAAVWLKSERIARGWSTIETADKARGFARAAGDGIALTQQSVSTFEQGNAKRVPSWLGYVRKAFADEPGQRIPQFDKTPDISDRQPTVNGNEGSIALRQVDIRYSMGPGSTMEDYPEEGTLDFDANLLRIITNSPPERLFVAKGDGDSMFPTLINDDIIIIDTMQRKLNLIDKIWAISLYGGGGIKRLRAISNEKVEVISDNPAHDNQIVDSEDLHIVGRVVWAGRRI